MAEELYQLNNNLQKKVEEATLKYEQVNSELLEKTRKLEDSNKRLEELDGLKSDFVSMVSHELRTPLTAIIGFAKTMQKLELPEEQKTRYLKIIEEEGQRLSQMVEDFLDISKIESGRLYLDMHIINLKDIAEEAMESFSGIEIKSYMTGERLMICADKGKIKQVLINIISNAVKYNPPGSPIELSLEKENEKIHIQVKDYGMGIKKEDIFRIFEKFFRCDDNISKKNRGSGLGLAISKEIIKQHKGSIWAESEPGKATVMHILLPEANNA